MRDRLLQPGFPAGFHLFFGGGGELKDLGGGSSLGVNKNKVSKNLGGGSNWFFFFGGGGGSPPQNGPAGNPDNFLLVRKCYCKCLLSSVML